MIERILRASGVILFAIVGGDQASASELFAPVIDSFTAFCSGRCAVTVFAGPQLKTDLAAVLGVEGIFTPPWRYKWGNSQFLGASLSRDLYQWQNYFKVEVEAGLGKRFGAFHETDGWGAIYFRWTDFPWNDRIKTSVAVSTGLDLASAVPYWEAHETGVPGGSKLMHYFSPELTFAIPERPGWEMVLRVHHRSGGRQYWGNAAIFHGTGGGIQYGVVGLRHHF